MKRIITILIFIIIGLSTFGLHQLDRARRSEKAVVTLNRREVIWRDKYEHSNAEIENLKLDKKNLLKIHSEYADSLKKQGIKIKYVEKIVTLTKVTTDTVTLVKNQYVDRWTDIRLIDSNKVAYKFKDSLALITYDKKYGFLKLKTSYVTRATSYNPHTTLTGITSTEIIPHERRIHLGIYAGYGVTKVSTNVYAGPQLGAGI
jgi:hypothetical protein